MKKIAEKSGSDSGFKPVLSRKKKKSVALEEGVSGKRVLAEVSSGHFWGSETGDTTESESIDMEEKCLVEKTSFDYGESGAITNKEHDQTPKGPGITTKTTLGKSLGKINFSSLDVNDNVLLDAPLKLPPPLKNLVSVSVRKSFALDIGLDKVKLIVVRRLFSRVNSFGGASALSKFSGIICASFTSEASLVQAMEKTRAADILVNTNLKKSASHSDQAVVVKKIPVGTSAKAVCAALSEFGIIKSIKMQLVGLWQKALVEFEQLDQADLVAVEWSILIEKDVICIARADLDKVLWDKRDHHRMLLYTLPMKTNAHDIWNFKTCVINRHLVTYAQVRCAVVCFNFAESLDAVMGTTPVFRDSNLRWSSLVSVRCAKCEKLGHTSLSCAESGKVFSGDSFHKVLSDSDKSRLAAIYAKCSVLVAHPIFFGGLSWVKVASGFSFPPLSDRVVSENVGSSLEMKPSLTAAVEINDRFAALECSLTSLTECVNMLAKRLTTPNQRADIVISKSLGVATSSKTVMEAVIFDNSVIGKMEDTLRNLAIMVMGLLAKIDNADMIKDKFEGVRIFTSGLEEGYVGAGVAIVMCGSLACHVSKVEKVLGRVVSVHLLFKNKLLVTFLDLYAGVLAKMRFAQAFGINSLIFKAVNTSSFVMLCGDFNENEAKKCASFKKCSDLGLVNSLGGSPVHKLSTWSNSQGINKVINYIFISENLVSAVVGQKIALVSGFFNTNHNMVGVLLWLEGLWVHFKELSSAALKNSNLDGMWEVLKDAVCGLANKVFSKHWFCEFDGPRNKQSLRFFGLEFLVVKVLKCLCSGHVSEFDSLVRVWMILDNIEASKFTVMLQNGLKSDVLHGHLKCCLVLSDIWAHQYASLAHVGDNVFLGVMCEISSDKLSSVVSRLPNGKATGFSDISNKLWKHSGDGVMVCLLDLLNSCLKVGDVPNGILINTRLIALIETARKILFKVLLDHISFAYSKFGVLHGDNFSVLKGTSIQSPIFAVGLIVEDALEKGHEIWLVL
ncbi:hypothetical protein G9A89_003090 [Geosiphon pyriformis]|nr:hypothetical protein G9A89_003090 [Geosiphon pyriformis]